MHTHTNTNTHTHTHTHTHTSFSTDRTAFNVELLFENTNKYKSYRLFILQVVSFEHVDGTIVYTIV